MKASVIFYKLRTSICRVPRYDVFWNRRYRFWNYKGGEQTYQLESELVPQGCLQPLARAAKLFPPCFGCLVRRETSGRSWADEKTWSILMVVPQVWITRRHLDGISSNRGQWCQRRKAIFSLELRDTLELTLRRKKVKEVVEVAAGESWLPFSAVLLPTIVNEHLPFHSFFSPAILKQQKFNSVARASL